MASPTRRRGRGLDPPKGGTDGQDADPLQDAIDEFLLGQRVKQHSPNTVHSYEEAIRDFEGRLGEEGRAPAAGELTTELLRADQLNPQTELTIFGRTRTPSGWSTRCGR